MRALDVDESRLGTTHRTAGATGRGLAETLDVEDVDAALRPEGVDLLVVGGPAHVHGNSSPRTRAAAPTWAATARGGVHLDGHEPPPLSTRSAPADPATTKETA